MADRREHVLYVKNVWWEPGVRKTKKLETALNGRLKSLCRLNECKEVKFLQEVTDSGR